MTATVLSGPSIVTGSMGTLPATFGRATPDYNPDAGPSITYQGDGLPDVRFPLMKEKLAGYPGVMPAFMNLPYMQSCDIVPSAGGGGYFNTAGPVSGTPLTPIPNYATVGYGLNVPIMPFTGAVNGSAPVTVAMVLDFGFAYASATAGSPTLTVADSTQFPVGMPLIVAGIGNSGGTACLLTYVMGAPSATTVTMADNALATLATAPVGTGNYWNPREEGILRPTGHYPYLAGGPGLFLDPQQALTRGVAIQGSTSAVGGVFLVSGYDCYWQPMTQAITHPGGNVAAYSTKTFKAVASVVPQFTDAHAYYLFATDLFGFAVRIDRYEYANAFWNAGYLTAATGFTPAVTAAATSTTGDVRGTWQMSASGPGAGASANPSNGVLSSLVMTGRRLALYQSVPAFQMLRGSPTNPAPVYGQTQA